MNETEYKTLKELSTDGTLSQRDLSKRIGLSLGSVNYIIKELVKKGYIKTQKIEEYERLKKEIDELKKENMYKS